MCGRYSLFDTDRLYERFNVSRDNHVPLPDRYNVTPYQTMPVITNDGTNRLHLMRWGLIPRWAKLSPRPRLIINARAATLAAKATFRPSLISQRCLVPASGYFEWQNTGSHKQPFFFHFPNNLIFAFAGLYDTAPHPPDHEALDTYTIITTNAPDNISYIYPRMPVILDRSQENFWLDPDQADPDMLTEFLTTMTEPKLIAHPVSPLVNNPGNDSPDQIKTIKLLRHD